MNINFPEASDELEVDDGTGISKTRGGEYVGFSWGYTVSLKGILGRRRGGWVTPGTGS